MGISDTLGRIWIRIRTSDYWIQLRIRLFSSVTLRMQKKVFFFIFFSYNLPAGILSSVLKIQFFAQKLCKNFILKALFQSAQHLYEERERSRSGSIPLTNGSGFGRPKNMQIRISNTRFKYLEVGLVETKSSLAGAPQLHTNS